MGKVIVVANQKGGVGKTVTCVNFGIGLAREGKKVLLIDADPQGALTISLGNDEPDRIEYSLATAMMKVINDESFEVEDGIIHHEEGVDLLPGNVELSGLEISMMGVISRETLLREYVEKARDMYDFIIIDCMPSLGMLTINALACVDSVLIPVQAAYLPVKGLQQLIKTIGRVGVYLLLVVVKIVSFLITRFYVVNSAIVGLFSFMLTYDKGWEKSTYRLMFLAVFIKDSKNGIWNLYMPNSSIYWI